MTTLESDFESDLRDHLLDEAEGALYDDRDNLAFQFLKLVNQNWEDYMRSTGYALEHIPESGRVIDTERRQNSVSATLEWSGLTSLFEWGVSPHAIQGNPLAFDWPAPPEGTRPEGAPSYIVANQVNWGSVTGGIPAARAIRGALNQIRFRAQGGQINL